MRAQLLQQLAQLPMDAARLCLWFALLGLVFLVLERLWPLHSQRVFRKAFGTDVIYYFLSGLLPKFLLVIPLNLFAGFLHRTAPIEYYVWAELQPEWIRLLAGIVVADVGSYWGHRWSHKIPFLWRFHSVHHSALEMDWLINSRAHPVDMAFTRLCGLIPMYALGLAQPMDNSQVDLVPVIATLVGTFWSFLIHANVKWRFGFLEQLVSTPAFHHWHHTNDNPSVIDKNYAATLPWVDRLFGTLYLPKAWPVVYGTDTTVADGIGRQLLQPFGPFPAPSISPSSRQAKGSVEPGALDQRR